MSEVKLLSADGQLFVTDRQSLNCSNTLKIALDMEEDGGKADEIPLTNVYSRELKRVLDYAKFHKDDSKKLNLDEARKRADEVEEFNANFLNMDQAELFDLISAADYLEIKDLMQISCKAVAKMIEGKNPAQIRRMFNIKPDLKIKRKRLNKRRIRVMNLSARNRRN